VGVAIESVHLRKRKPIHVKVAALIRSKAVELDHPFIVSCARCPSSAGGLVETFSPLPLAGLAGDSLAETTAGSLRWPICALTEKHFDLQRARHRRKPGAEIETRPCCAGFGSVGFRLPSMAP